MRRHRLPLLPALLLLFPLATRGGEKIADFDVTCPLFGHQFQAQALVKDEASDILDSDFCKRVVGESPYVLAVWTCPYCFFSAYQADFHGGKSLDPSFRDMDLRSYPVDPETIEQAQIFVAAKYHNAETYYRRDGRDARFLADLTLRGSWACRVFEVPEPGELVSFRQEVLETVPGASQIRNVELLNLELEKKVRTALESGAVPEEQRDIYRYLRADALRQSGDHVQARALFDALVDEGKLPENYRRAAAHKAFLCAKEGEFQKKTLDYLAEAEAKGLIEDEEQAEVTYLRGELSRRLGRLDDARRFYDAAAAMEGAAASLRELIDRQRQRLPAAGAGKGSAG